MSSQTEQMTVVTLKWVRIEKFCDLTGYTPSAVRGKMSTGIWASGIHFSKAPDGHILINLEAYQSWVEGQESAFAAHPSRSVSTGEASGSRKRLWKNRKSY